MRDRNRLDNLARSAVACHACFQGKSLHRSFVDLAQPRYIGSGYWESKQKVAFVMLNPGSGQGDWRNEDWRSQIYRFRDEGASLDSVFASQRRHMPFWANGKLPKFIEAHGLNLDNIALANIAWCAAKENKYPVWMLNKCLELHTLEWLHELAPSLIVLSGTAAHRFETRIAQAIPDAMVLGAFHYAHRPVDKEKAMARAREIRELIGAA